MNYIDLHVHSTASDGTLTPIELVDYAISIGQKAIAITDHDTVNGLKEAIEYSKDKDIKIIPGVELSTEYNNKDIHMLGLFIDYNNKAFINKLNHFNQLRMDRNNKMCELLSNLGFNISLDKMYEKFGDTIITRAHFARYLLDNNYISSMKEAFDKYLSDGCPCYVPKVKCSPYEAIEIIKNANGFPVLAHPLLYNYSLSELDSLVKSFKNSGLIGIEAIYSLNEGDDESNMIRLAQKYDLFITGGSDFHGSNKPDIDLGTGKGNLKIPYSLLNPFLHI